jgi:hypothetical protein
MEADDAGIHGPQFLTINADVGVSETNGVIDHLGNLRMKDADILKKDIGQRVALYAHGIDACFSADAAAGIADHKVAEEGRVVAAS